MVFRIIIIIAAIIRPSQGCGSVISRNRITQESEPSCFPSLFPHHCHIMKHSLSECERSRPAPVAPGEVHAACLLRIGQACLITTPRRPDVQISWRKGLYVSGGDAARAARCAVVAPIEERFHFLKITPN